MWEYLELELKSELKSELKLSNMFAYGRLISLQVLYINCYQIGGLTMSPIQNLN